MRQLVVLDGERIKIIREISKAELIVLQEHINTLNLFSKDFNRLSMIINSLNEFIIVLLIILIKKYQIVICQIEL